MLLTFVFAVLLCQAQEEKLISAPSNYKKDIQNLSNNQKVKSAFQIIKDLEPETMKELIQLTQTPAPPFMEQKRAEYFKQLLQNAGIDSIWIDGAGNVMALRKGTGNGKTILFEAHLDTVFPLETDVTVKVKGDTLFAPGIGDDTRGLSMLLTIAKAMNKAQISTQSDILFSGTVGEEGLGDLRGIKYIFNQKNLKIDSHIAIDGGNINHLVSKGLGSIRYKISFKGPGGHSWGAFGLANPHHGMAKATDYFSIAAAKYVTNGPKTTFNIGRVGGGTSVNSIPFESWIEVDMRSLSPEKLKGIEQILLKEMQRGLDDYNAGVKKGDKLSLIVEKIGERPSGDLGDELPLIQKAAAVIEHFGYKTSVSAGSTNSNTPISLGIPSITIGRGGIGGAAHSLDEWWMNQNGAEAIQFGLLLLLAEAGLN